MKLAEGYGAIEVETHQRVPARLLGTINMYDELTDNSESPITGVPFVTKDNVIADQIQRAARKAMLSPPHMKIRSLSEIIQQTSTAGWGKRPDMRQPDYEELIDREDGRIAADRLADIEAGRVTPLSADEVARALAR